MALSASATAPTWWAVSPPRVILCPRGEEQKQRGKAVEKTVPPAGPWKSRQRRGIPTFPQPRRRRSSRRFTCKPDRSRAIKTGHLHVLTTAKFLSLSGTGEGFDSSLPPNRQSRAISLLSGSYGGHSLSANAFECTLFQTKKTRKTRRTGTCSHPS